MREPRIDRETTLNEERSSGNWKAALAVAAVLLALTAARAAVSPGASGRPGRARWPAVLAGGRPSADASATADTSWEDRYRGVLVRAFRPEAGYRAVALTFDDGPNRNTGYVIRTVQGFGGHATFFDTGKNLLKHGYGAQAVVIAAAGFELGNHTQDHMPGLVSTLWHQSFAHDVYEISNVDKIIGAYAPVTTLWLRPPGGSIDAVGMKAAASTGHLVVNFSIDSNDSHGPARTAGDIYRMCTTGVKPGDVILLHVTSTASMSALPRICATLTGEGFQLVTVSELARHSTPIPARVPR